MPYIYVPILCEFDSFAAAASIYIYLHIRGAAVDKKQVIGKKSCTGIFV